MLNLSMYTLLAVYREEWLKMNYSYEMKFLKPIDFVSIFIP